MKTKEQILRLAGTIKKQHDALPDFSSFGDDNSEEKDAMLKQYNDLISIASSIDGEAMDWVMDKPSDLIDYLL